MTLFTELGSLEHPIRQAPRNLYKVQYKLQIGSRINPYITGPIPSF